MADEERVEPVDGAASSALAEFARLFDRGAFWDAHEVLEALWRRDGDPVWQGLIQVAAACVHIQKGRPSPALRVLDRALGHLDDRGSPFIDVPEVRRRAERLRARLRAGEAGESSLFEIATTLE